MNIYISSWIISGSVFLLAMASLFVMMWAITANDNDGSHPTEDGEIHDYVMRLRDENKSLRICLSIMSLIVLLICVAILVRFMHTGL